MSKTDEVGAMLMAEIPKTQTLDELHQLLQRGVLMLKGEERVRHGCYCDLEPGMAPDGCVLDYNRPEDCVHAPVLLRQSKDKWACVHWRPL
jgi:hypothetical protein